MTDEGIYLPPVPQFVQDTLKLQDSMPRVEPLPPEVVRAALAVRPYTDAVREAMAALPDFRVVTPHHLRALLYSDYLDEVGEAKAASEWPVPTAEELAETETVLLRRRVSVGRSRRARGRIQRRPCRWR